MTGMSRLRGITFSAMLLLGLSACSVLPEPVVLTQYQLPAERLPATRQASSTRDYSIRIVAPYTDQAHGSTRIIVLPDGNQVSAYEGARWMDNGPVLLRNRLASGLRDIQQFKSVVLDVDNAQADFELDSNLELFQVQYQQGQPVVQIRFDARLSDVRRGSPHLMQAHRFSIEQKVDGSSVADVVRAFGVAGDTLTREIAQWILAQPLP